MLTGFLGMTNLAGELPCAGTPPEQDLTNLDQFERKKLDGKVLITRKDSHQRINGSNVKLSSDLP